MNRKIEILFSRVCEMNDKIKSRFAITQKIFTVSATESDMKRDSTRKRKGGRKWEREGECKSELAAGQMSFGAWQQKQQVNVPKL